MAHTHRAPKQWALSKNETINTFDSWKQNLVYSLSCDGKFAQFLADGTTWQKRTRANAQTRGFTNDGDEVEEGLRRTGQQKCIELELMLGQIANFCPVIARNSIVKDSTSLPQIWQTIRLHYGFHSTGAHLLELSNMHLESDERPEDLYQRLLAFMDDNLMQPENNITHHGEAITEPEDIQPTLENMIVWLWLHLLHKDLPSLVKQRYGTELRNKSLASIKPEISQALDSLLEEIGSPVSKAFRTNTFTYKARPRTKPSVKVCPICQQVGRADQAHFLSECKYLPETDRKFLLKARQVGGIEEESMENMADEVQECPSTVPIEALHVKVRQSPYLDMFYEHFTTRVVMDSGATGNMIRASTAARLGVKVQKSSQSAQQADGSSPLIISGEVRLTLSYDNVIHHFEGLVVENLDSEILAGMPFLEANDITLRPARRQIILKNGREYSYGSLGHAKGPHRVCRAHVIRAPSETTTLWPGDFIEVTVGDDREGTYAIEPNAAAQKPTGCEREVWPVPFISECVAGRVRIPNTTPGPIIIKKNAHIGKAVPVYNPDPVANNVATKQTHFTPIKCGGKVSELYSCSVSIDPNNTLPAPITQQFYSLMETFDNVFNPKFSGYGGQSGPFQAVVNMGPSQPPQRKGRLPQYARDRLVELQQKFDELEELGVFGKPEDLDITVEYLNPSFLVNKPSGGTRLVTAFADVGRYSKPQPSLLPDVNSTLQQIGQWKYIICTDLSKAFYQIPLSKPSMKYCGVATPFRGVRVYTRCAMGMPGSETALEELMCRVLGHLLQNGSVAKLADDLYCGANTPQELLENWRQVLEALDANDLRLSAAKTVINPTCTTILGWKWQQGSIEASPHRVSTLASCTKPLTVKGMRSFIGAYKVLARVLPNCSTYINPLDEAIAGRDSKDSIEWSEQLDESFSRAQAALATCRSIVLPKRSDKLWIVTDGSVKQKGIAATMYAIQNDKPKLAGFFSAKLRDRQILWLPCEIEALAITAAIRHFSPYLIQSDQHATVLTDSKPCVQAFEKLCRGEFSASPRVTTFLSTVSRYQASIQHIKGVANLPSDHASRNPPQCTEPLCQVCTFIMRTEESVVRQSSVQDILSGKARAPFTSRSVWSSMQAECADLRRTKAHLRQGTRPSKKLTNVNDIKRYLQVAAIARDDLVVVKRNIPLERDKECIIVPRFAIDGFLTALHLQLGHPSEHQLKVVFCRYMYALDLSKAAARATKACHICASLQSSPKALIEQSTGHPPERVGIMFAADVMRREQQLVLVVREYVTSLTKTMFIDNERHECLRDAIITCCIDMCPLDGPPCVVRTDCARGFQALCEDPLMRKHNIIIELGRVKNINKNPVAEKAVQELEEEIVKSFPRGGRLTHLELAVITTRLNTRIRSRGLSSKEMWQQRDQFTNDQLPIKDLDLIEDQHVQRQSNHKYSEKSKANGAPARPITDISIGDIVYLHTDGNKHQARDRYIVCSVEGEWCNIKKFTGSQLRNTTYRVKKNECFRVGISTKVISKHTADIRNDGRAQHEENNVDHSALQAPIEIMNPLEEHLDTEADHVNEHIDTEADHVNEHIDTEADHVNEHLDTDADQVNEQSDTDIDIVDGSPEEQSNLRRSTRNRKPPEWYGDIVSYLGRIVPCVPEGSLPR